MTIQQRGDDVYFAVVPVEAGADAGKIGEAFTAISRMTEVLASRRSTRTW